MNFPVTGPLNALIDLGFDFNRVMASTQNQHLDFSKSVSEFDNDDFKDFSNAIDMAYAHDEIFFEKLLSMGKFVHQGSLGPLIDSLVFCSDGIKVLKTMEALQCLYVKEYFDVITLDQEVILRWPHSDANKGSILLSWGYISFMQMLLDRAYRLKSISPKVIYYNRSLNYHNKIEERFKCPVKKGALFEVIYDKASLEQETDASNQVFADTIFKPYMDNYLSSDELLANLIREKLDALLVEGKVTLEELAASFHVTPRTIQRRLKQCDLTFAQLVQQEKERMAKYMLINNGATVFEVSEALSYNDPTTFSRAFKGWTGVSPSEYRELHS